MLGALVNEELTWRILKAFIKKLDVVPAGWDPKPYCWLEQG